MKTMSVDTFLIITFLALFIPFLFFSLMGQSRISKLAKSYTDPNDEAVASALRLLNHLRQMQWNDYKISKSTTVELVYSLLGKLEASLKNTPEAQKIPWNQIVIFMNERELVSIVHSQTEISQLQSNIEMLRKKLPDHSLESYIKHRYYQIHDSKYFKLSIQNEEWEKAVKLFEVASREINEAQSAVSSASTMETIDLFSSNKGISILSTMSNSSASDELDDIQPALQNLFAHLKKLEVSEKEFSASIQVSDWGDLFTDLFFNFSFDFMSVFSLMKLSSASSDLEELEMRLSPVGTKIRSFAEQHEKARQTYLNSLA